MDLEQAVVARLKADPAILALCAGRAYPMIAAQGVPFPYLVWQVPSRLQSRSFAGIVALNSYRMTVDAWAGDYATARRLGKAVVDSFDGFAGRIGGGLVNVQGAFADDASDDHEEPLHADDTGAFRCSVELSIYWGG